MKESFILIMGNLSDLRNRRKRSSEYALSGWMSLLKDFLENLRNNLKIFKLMSFFLIRKKI